MNQKPHGSHTVEHTKSQKDARKMQTNSKYRRTKLRSPHTKILSYRNNDNDEDTTKERSAKHHLESLSVERKIANTDNLSIQLAQNALPLVVGHTPHVSFGGLRSHKRRSTQVSLREAYWMRCEDAPVVAVVDDDAEFLLLADMMYLQKVPTYTHTEPKLLKRHFNKQTLVQCTVHGAHQS